MIYQLDEVIEDHKTVTVQSIQCCKTVTCNMHTVGRIYVTHHSYVHCTTQNDIIFTTNNTGTIWLGMMTLPVGDISYLQTITIPANNSSPRRQQSIPMAFPTTLTGRPLHPSR